MRKKEALLAAATAVLLLAQTLPAAAAELPAAWDPRPDQVSAVREQYWGTCWDFGGISSLESYLIKFGLADTSVDLSEEDVLWWVNGNYSDPDLNNPSSGFGWTNLRRNDGGYAAMTTGYLATVGARAESDIPYLGAAENPEDDQVNDYYYEGTNQKPANYDTAPVLYQVTDIVYLDETAGPEDIKQAILDYGAVTVSYFDSTEYFHADTASYWYPESGEAENGNHTVSVVGWNDSYSKENFATADGQTPASDGAWLIKNSYGTDYGNEGGYTWVSYEDKLLFEVVEYNQMYAIAGARAAEERKAYYNDEYGAVSSYYPETEGSFTCANVYEFGSGEALEEVMFMTWSEGAGYILSYAPVENGVPVADASRWTTLAEGTVGHAGYTTVALEEPMEVPEGTGALVLTLSGDNLNIGTDESLLEGSRPLFNASIQRNSSFFLKDGTFQEACYEATNTYGDIYTAYVNLTLRAYTADIPEPTETPGEEPSVPPVTPTAEPTAEPADPTEPENTEPSASPSGTEAAEEREPASAEKISTTQDIEDVRTGDGSNSKLWISVAAGAAAVLVVIVVIAIVRKHFGNK